MSQFATFFIPMTDDGTVQNELNRFLCSHRVLQVEKAVFPSGWTFCVEWVDGKSLSHLSNEASGFRQFAKIDYREVLAPEVFARFAKLRERRKQIALEDGVKAYIVMTDAQLAELAKSEVPTITDMKKIEGVGDARVEKYAERLLRKEVGDGGDEPDNEKRE